MMTKALLDSKLESLWYSTRLTLLPTERDFTNKIRALFSQQQKEVINKVKKGEKPEIDLDKYSDKFINIYMSLLDALFNKAKKRALAEANVDNISEELENKLKSSYSLKYVVNVVSLILQHTQKHLNQIYAETQDIPTLIDEINKYFNKAKSNRVKLITTTEAYRSYNFFYLKIMIELGYTYKMYIAKPNTDCPICKPTNKQVKLITDNFDLSQEVSGDLLLNRQFPPVHPNSTSIVLALKRRV